jgi:phenylacetate-CoA ligase
LGYFLLLRSSTYRHPYFYLSETRPRMNDRILSQLQRQIEKLFRMDFYREKLSREKIHPSDVATSADFKKIPFTTSGELFSELRKPPTECSLYSDAVTRINFSPSGKELYPVYHTAQDLAYMHEVCCRTLADAGVAKEDICAVTFGYHLFVAGLFYQNQLEAYGAKVIPLGPGESERAVKLINDCRATVLVSNPTFAMKLAGLGIPSVRVLFVGGEPFTSVTGYAQKVRAAFNRDITIIDSYSMAQCLPIARSCRHERGLHIADEFVYAEVVDPISGEPLPFGEKGELVLTHLKKDAAPLLRYRTGDLTFIEHGRCRCGREYTLPKSIIGRTDEMLKVKGVKFWPSQVGPLLCEFSGATGRYRVIVEEETGVDRLSLTVEISQPLEPGIDALSQRLKQETLLTFNRIETTDDLENGPLVIDNRRGRNF